jgi:WD40 repeat protein
LLLLYYNNIMLFLNNSSISHSKLKQQQQKRFQQTLQPVLNLQNSISSAPITVASGSYGNNNLLLSGNIKGEIQLHCLNRINQTLLYPTPHLPGATTTLANNSRESIKDISWYPHDDDAFATLGGRYDGSSQGRVKIWDVETLEVVVQFPLESTCNSLAWACDVEKHQLIAVTSGDGTLRLLNLETGNGTHIIRPFGDSNSAVTACAWSICETNIIACGSSSGQVKLFDIRKPKEEITTLDEYRFETADHSLENNITTETTSSTTKRIKSTSSNTANTTKSKFASVFASVRTIAFVDEGKHLITGSAGNTLRLWKFGKQGFYHRVFIDYPAITLHSFEENGQAFIHHSLAWSDQFCTIFAPASRPNQHVLYAFDGGWGTSSTSLSANNPKTSRALMGHIKPIDCIVCRDQYEEVISISAVDGCFIVWEPKSTNNELLDDHDRIKFSSSNSSSNHSNNHNNGLDYDDDNW